MAKNLCDICNKEIKYSLDVRYKNNIKYSNKIFIGLHSDDNNEDYNYDLHLCDDCYTMLSSNIINIISSNKKEKKKSLFNRIFISK